MALAEAQPSPSYSQVAVVPLGAAGVFPPANNPAVLVPHPFVFPVAVGKEGIVHQDDPLYEKQSAIREAP